MKPGRNDPCPCGSGKKFKKCCAPNRADSPADMSPLALDDAEAHYHSANALQRLGNLAEAVAAYRRALALNPNLVEAHINMGNALRGLGALAEAAASYRRALALKPDHALVHSNLGALLRGLGQFDDAVASFRRALEIKPDFVEAHNNLGNALKDLGRLDEAVASYRQALVLRPDLAEVHSNLGNALMDQGRLDEAAASYRRALISKPDYVEAHTNLGIVLRLQSRAVDAEASCRRALKIHPESVAAMSLLAELHGDNGRIAEAEELFKRAIAIDPQLPQAWAGIATLRKMTSGDAGWLAEARRIAAGRLPPSQEASLRYAIGKFFDDTGDFEQAFSNYQRANELTKMYAAPYDAALQKQAIDRIIEFFDRRWVSQVNIEANASLRPVFIVGMPRSGTTLAEQILASHPSVFGAGELPFWNTAWAMYTSSTLTGAAASASVLPRLADDYLRLLEELAPNMSRVVDKMPANFLFLGLIHVVLPKARIIHMRRNPIDTCLSIYFQRFESTHPYAHDLGDLAHNYTEYWRLMKHWRLILPSGTILEVPYEGLVDDAELWSRKMVEFIGLPWDPACLDFHQTTRTVSTFTKWQARQKITRSSVERWRHYEKFVGPLLSLAKLEYTDRSGRMMSRASE
jgi:tetratricopeptide (TPR) repeat protein